MEETKLPYGACQNTFSVKHPVPERMNFVSKIKTIQESNRELLLDALNVTEWDITKTKAMIGVSRGTIYRWLKEFEITKKRRARNSEYIHLVPKLVPDVTPKGLKIYTANIRGMMFVSTSYKKMAELCLDCGVHPRLINFDRDIGNVCAMGSAYVL